jgi:hypothetical protein
MNLGDLAESLLPLLFCFLLIQFLSPSKFLYTQVSRSWLFLALAFNLIFIEFLRNSGSTGTAHKLVSYFYNWFPAQERWLDSKILYDSVSCSKQYNLFEPNPCFTFLWNYPTFYNLIPSALNHFIFFISLAILPIVIIFVYFVFNQQRINILVLLFWISPPVLFLIERANFEGLIVLLLIIAERAFFKFQNSMHISRFIYLGMFSLSITFATSIKFYPIVILLYFILISRRLGEKLFLASLLLLNSILSVAVFDLLLFVGNAPSPDGKALGAKVFFRNILESPLEFVLLSTVIILSIRFPKRNLQKFNASIKSLYERDMFGLSLVFLFLCTWFVGGNTQYRLILLAPFFLNIGFQKGLNKEGPIFFLALCYSTTWPLLSNLLCLVLCIPILRAIYTFSFNEYSKKRT